MEHYLPDAHCLADDTQLYLRFKPLSNTAQADAIQAIEVSAFLYMEFFLVLLTWTAGHPKADV